MPTCHPSNVGSSIKPCSLLLESHLQGDGSRLDVHHQMNGQSIHTMEFYLSIKKNKIMTCAEKWTELENTVLNEETQVQENNDDDDIQAQVALKRLRGGEDTAQ